MNTPVALITGGSRGIGLGIAHSLANEGHALVINGIRPKEDVQEVVQSLAEVAPNVQYVAADISEAEDRTHLLEQTRAHYGRLDTVIHNAGVAPNQRLDLLEATEESFDRVLDINLKGPYFLAQAAARWMLAQRTEAPDRRLTQVFITSISATVASINRGEYCVSKAGLSMANQLFATRLAPHDVHVYEVRPGIIATDLTAPVKARYDALIAEGLLLEPRWGTPEDIGRAVASLVRGDLLYAPGQVLTVDGGLTARRL